MIELPDLDPATFTTDQTLIALAELRDAWSWLCLLVEPGRETTSSGTAVDDTRAERLEAIGHSDRAYRDYNLRHGMSALPPSPAAARISVIDAQVAVHHHLAEAVQLLAKTGNTRTRARAAAASRTVPGALDWLAGFEIGLGLTGRDGVWLIPGALVRVRDPQLAADVDRIVQRANRTARAAAAMEDNPVRPIEHRCPACGRRSLQLEMTNSHDRTKWLTRCVSDRCRCTGPGELAGPPACGCLRRSTSDVGRPHVWTYAELDGPRGLLAALAVYDLQQPDIRSGAAGHGGWQSRNMATPKTKGATA